MSNNVKVKSLDDYVKLDTIKEVNNDIKNTFTTCIFLPDNGITTFKNNTYLQGFIKLVETFKTKIELFNKAYYGEANNKLHKKWKLKVYYDSMFDDTKITINNNNNTNTLKFSNLYNNKFNNTNNNKTKKRHINNNKEYKTLLYGFKRYLDIIKDNKDNKYDLIELISYKNLKKTGSVIGNNTTYGSIVRLFALFNKQHKYDCVYAINGSHALSTVLLDKIYNWLDENKFYIQGGFYGNPAGILDGYLYEDFYNKYNEDLYFDLYSRQNFRLLSGVFGINYNIINTEIIYNKILYKNPFKDPFTERYNKFIKDLLEKCCTEPHKNQQNNHPKKKPHLQLNLKLDEYLDKTEQDGKLNNLFNDNFAKNDDKIIIEITDFLSNFEKVFTESYINYETLFEEGQTIKNIEGTEYQKYSYGYDELILSITIYNLFNNYKINNIDYGSFIDKIINTIVNSDAYISKDKDSNFNKILNDVDYHKFTLFKDEESYNNFKYKIIQNFYDYKKVGNTKEITDKYTIIRTIIYKKVPLYSLLHTFDEDKPIILYNEESKQEKDKDINITKYVSHDGKQLCIIPETILNIEDNNNYNFIPYKNSKKSIMTAINSLIRSYSSINILSQFEYIKKEKSNINIGINKVETKPLTY